MSEGMRGADDKAFKSNLDPIHFEYEAPWPSVLETFLFLFPEDIRTWPGSVSEELIILSQLKLS